MANVEITFTVDGKVVATVPMQPKTFSSGNEGYWAGNVRVYIENEQHIGQAQFAAVRNKAVLK